MPLVNRYQCIPRGALANVTRRRFGLMSLGAAASALLPKPAFASTPWDLVFVPDPQYMADSTVCTNAGASAANRMYNRMLQWVIDNHTATIGGLTLNIKAVCSLGDCANGVTAGHQSSQDIVVAGAWGLLDTAGIPYAVCAGNHDYEGSSGHPTDRNTIGWNFTAGLFSPSSRASFFGSGVSIGSGDTAYWIGSYTDPTFPQSGANSAIRLVVAGQGYTLCSGEFYPRSSALSWAREIRDTYPTDYFFFLTHGYLTDTGIQATRTSTFGPATYSLADAPASNSGQQMWSGSDSTWGGFTNWYEPPHIIACGHWINPPVDGASAKYFYRTAASSVRSRTTQQIFANQQELDRTGTCGGNPPNGTSNVAHLMIMHFDGSAVSIYLVATNSGNWMSDPTGSAPAWGSTPTVVSSFTLPVVQAPPHGTITGAASVGGNAKVQ